MERKHAHIVTRVNASQIKKEVIDGEEHYRIPSATLPDGVVMNQGYYPAEEIEAAYKGLEGAPAPLGHPMVNGEFVSALSPRAMNKYSVGAWNENVRRENGRVLLDKVINVRVANQTEGGKKLLKAIEDQAPIHTSTGLLLEMEVANGESNGKPYKWIARNMRFDHDAILLDEPGAATPEEGVGMFVNSAGEKAEVFTCNLDLDSDDWMVEDLARQAILSQHEAEKNSLMDKLRQAIKSVLGSTQESSESSLATNQAKAPEGDMTKEEMQELLKPITDQLTAVNTEIASIKEAQSKQGETVDALKANADAAANAEKDALKEQVKAAGFEDADIEGMSVNAMKKIVAKQQPSQGFHLNAHFAGNADASKPQDTLPE